MSNNTMPAAQRRTLSLMASHTANPSPISPLHPWLDDLLNKALKRTGGITAHVSFMDPATGHLMYIHAAGKFADVYRQIGGASKQGVTNLAAGQKRWILIGEARKTSEWQAALREAQDAGETEYVALLYSFNSEIAVPLLGPDKTVLAVINIHHPDKFGLDGRSIRIVKSLFKGASRTIQNAIPYEAAVELSSWEHKMHEAIRRIREGTAQNGSGAAVSLWTLIVQEGAAIAQAEVVGFWMYCQQSGEFHLATANSKSPIKYPKFRVPASEGLFSKSLNDRGAHYCGNTEIESDGSNQIPGVRSSYSLPIVDEKGVLGVLCFHSVRVDAFAPNLRVALKLFADLCGALISKNIAAIKAGVASECRLTILRADDERDFYRRAIDATLHLVSAQGASLFLTSADKRSLDLVASSGLAPGHDTDTSYDLVAQAGITPWVAVNGLALRIKNCGNKNELRRWDPRLRWQGKTREISSGEGFNRPLLVVPIHKADGSGDIVGVLRASGNIRQSEFFEEDKLALIQFAKMVASEVARPRVELSTLPKELASAWADPRAALGLILEKSLKLSEADAGTIFILEGEVLENVGWRGQLVVSTEDLRDAVRTSGVTSVCAKSRVTQIVDDVSQKEWLPIYKTCFEGIRSEMAVPLVYLGELYGVLNLESRVKAFFTRDRQVRVERLASVAAGYLAYQRVSEQNRALLRDRKLEEETHAMFWDALFSKATGPLSIPGGCDVSGYIISRPCGSAIGGDFYDAVSIDDFTVGILLGDGEKHGVMGAMQMLPLITAFKTNVRDSKSTKHVLGKILTAAREMHVRGSALYFMITKKDSKWYLYGSSAGHPQLIVVHRGGGHSLFPKQALAVRGESVSPRMILKEWPCRAEEEAGEGRHGDGNTETTGTTRRNLGSDHRVAAICGASVL